ncbi:centrosomal protein 20 isoform X5 [Ovis aries]|uniref:Centrosomal protein 20 n=1 Tax=Ovis aries TaxID=9940 RepID=A0AC11D7S9_SHEEP|nr:centrosomal protein 20 isoform X5 [Ovis aries]
MATVAELKAVLKDTLEKRGVLGHLKARIRAEVFSALDDESEPRPSLSHENFLINELIREYLEFNKYKYTASVLIAESGQPVVPLDRQFLIHELNAFEDSKNNTIPLLYGILAHFLHGTKDDNKNTFLKGSSLQPLNPNLGRPPSGRKQMVIGEGNGDPLQYSCLENSMDRGTWWAAVCGVTQSWTRLKRLSSSSSIEEPLRQEQGRGSNAESLHTSPSVQR